LGLHPRFFFGDSHHTPRPLEEFSPLLAVRLSRSWITGGVPRLAPGTGKTEQFGSSPDVYAELERLQDRLGRGERR
jgi:hypothetical protein